MFILPLHIHGELPHAPHDIPDALIDAFKESIEICALVILMMTLIEIFNVCTQGKMFHSLEKHKGRQIITSAALGLIPGCLGGFAGVSLYSHRMIGFGALLATLIATTGDEAFIMLAKFPGTALLMMCGLFVLGIGIGALTEIIVGSMQKKGKMMNIGADRSRDDNYEIHSCDCGHHHDGEKHSHHGEDGHEDVDCCNHHNEDSHEDEECGHHHDEAGNHHEECCHHHIEGEEHGHHVHNLRHFLEEHVWKHVIKRHLPTIFAWTFGVLALFGILSIYIDIETWIKGNIWLMLVIAVAAGLIPESGPHLVFVSMFAAGILPFPVLLANCISQDGHACLPLIAENKRSWLTVKLIKTVIAAAVGAIAILIYL